ncbi:hypothetical protein D0Z07_0846 [Hyphodiscus hymeniophilus]|uniref:RNase III domain-containing protein n=1 Tax=Hyphodiscus hymeniophilus TaxID=353542 RepID=A0A9P6VQL5_9HELO|nr:hypothetical protein D0Z07_0846 [Hyphodiscus hymeniophilus]
MKFSKGSWEALQIKGNGITQLGDRIIDDGNKKLALLGDSLLKTIVLDQWSYTGMSRKEGHELATFLGRNSHLEQCGHEAGLESKINYYPRLTYDGRKISVSQKVMSDTVQALVAAIYLDSGKNLNAVHKAMKGLGLYDYTA